MSISPPSGPILYSGDPNEVPSFDVMGPQIEFLVLSDDSNVPCVMRGTIPPGGIIPLHSHADPETFLALSGEIEGLVQCDGGFEWVLVRAGDVFHVPSGVKHAFRNRTGEPYVSLIVSTPKMGRFLREIGVPLPAGPDRDPPSEDRIRHFLNTSAKYGYWNAGPDENAEIGLSLLAG